MEQEDLGKTNTHVEIPDSLKAKTRVAIIGAPEIGRALAESLLKSSCGLTTVSSAEEKKHEESILAAQEFSSQVITASELGVNCWNGDPGESGCPGDKSLVRNPALSCSKYQKPLNLCQGKEPEVLKVRLNTSVTKSKHKNRRKSKAARLQRKLK